MDVCRVTVVGKEWSHATGCEIQFLYVLRMFCALEQRCDLPNATFINKCNGTSERTTLSQHWALSWAVGISEKGGRDVRKRTKRGVNDSAGFGL